MRDKKIQKKLESFALASAGLVPESPEIRKEVLACFYEAVADAFAEGWTNGCLDHGYNPTESEIAEVKRAFSEAEAVLSRAPDEAQYHYACYGGQPEIGTACGLSTTPKWGDQAVVQAGMPKGCWRGEPMPGTPDDVLYTFDKKLATCPKCLSAK